MLIEESMSLKPFFQKRLALIVDDDADSRLLLNLLLSESGWEVIEAKDGFEALLLIEQNPIDILILDNRMPGLSGIETYQRLPEKKNNIRVILLSAEPELKELASSIGIHYCLTKCFDLPDFLNLVELAYNSIY